MRRWWIHCRVGGHGKQLAFCPITFPRCLQLAVRWEAGECERPMKGVSEVTLSIIGENTSCSLGRSCVALSYSTTGRTEEQEEATQPLYPTLTSLYLHLDTISLLAHPLIPAQ